MGAKPPPAALPRYRPQFTPKGYRPGAPCVLLWPDAMILLEGYSDGRVGEMKALVVDDAPEVAEVIQLCFELRWPGSTVLVAGTGAEGLRLVKAENPDVVILDIGLPDMDGYQVCRQIRSFSDVPIVILTVRDQEADIARSREMGADDYITKPFSHTQFLERVRAALAKPRRGPGGPGAPPPGQARHGPR